MAVDSCYITINSTWNQHYVKMFFIHNFLLEGKYIFLLLSASPCFQSLCSPHSYLCIEHTERTFILMFQTPGREYLPKCIWENVCFKSALHSNFTCKFKAVLVGFRNSTVALQCECVRARVCVRERERERERESIMYV